MTRLPTRKHSFEDETEAIVAFIQSKVKEANAHGLVVGLSGGIDSAVVAALSVKALGARKVTGLYLFEKDARSSEDYEDAKILAKQLKIKTYDVSITPILNSFTKELRRSLNSLSRITLANLKARSRMIILYAFANERNLIVAGTGDRSEELLGYFTKYGDGAADILPIAHLYKTEVRALASYLRIPVKIITKPSSPNLWKGQLAVHELPADYDVLDPLLVKLFDEKKSPSEFAGKQNRMIIKEIKSSYLGSKHKRRTPYSLVEDYTEEEYEKSWRRK